MLISNGMFYFNHMFNNKNYFSAKIKNSTYSDAINEYYKTYGADESEREIIIADDIKNKKFTEKVNQIIPDLHKAIKKGDLKAAAKLGLEYYNLVKNCFQGLAKPDGDWLTFVSRGAIFYKGQSLEQWEEQLPVKTDSYTGITYFELDGYNIPTKEYRGEGYDKKIAKLADERNMSFSDINENTIFYTSKQRFDKTHGMYSNSDISSKIKKIGTSPFNRILDFIVNHQQHNRNTPLTEKMIENELKKYLEFENRLSSTKNIDEKKKLLNDELFKIIDKSIEREKEFQKRFHIYKERKELFDKARIKDELDRLLEKV